MLDTRLAQRVTRQQQFDHEMRTKAVAYTAALEVLHDQTGGEQLHVQYVSWEDLERCQGSCWGNRIADTTLRIKDGGEDGVVATGFLVKSENLNETIVTGISSKRFSVIANDPDGQNPRATTLHDLLSDLGTAFEHAGLDAGTDFTAQIDDGSVRLRTKLVFVPVDESGKAEMVEDCFSYGCEDENAEQLFLHCTPTGASLFEGRTSKFALGKQLVDADGDYSKFWHQLSTDGRKIFDNEQRESEMEQEAADRGEATAVPLGPHGCPNAANVTLTIGIPVEKPPSSPVYRNLADAVYTSEASGGVVYRSLFANDMPMARVDGLACKVNAGGYIEPAKKITTTNLVRDPTVMLTCTYTYFVCVPSIGIANEATLEHAKKTTEDILKVTGDPAKLFDAKFNCPPLTDAVMEKSTKKLRLTTRAIGVPVGL